MVFIYVLELRNGKYYVGKTNNPDFRLKNHVNSDGSEWTKLYKPIRLIELKPDCDDYDEDKITRQYMDKYGINNVRGGSFVSVKLDKSTINILEKMSNGTNNKCYSCGKTGHFAKDCEYQESSSEEESDNEDNFETWLKPEFIKKCKKKDITRSQILSGEEILKILKKLDKENWGDACLTHIYGLCQTINKCDLEYIIGEYRDGIEYETFIDGLIYVIQNDPKICDECDVEEKMCTCRKYRKNSLVCYRCGRQGHYANSCYATKHVRGHYI